ncbi:MAG: protein phosphatase 2C domain-containing protein, partial [Planctomycetales bacterium]
ANAQIYEKGTTDTEFQGMGTTCSAMLLVPQGAICGHVGDSRVYRLRNGKLEQLTFDHSLVWEMQVARKKTPEAAEIQLPKNIITRSLGPRGKVQVDLEGPFPVQKGDVYLLCSDGLTGPVTDEEAGTIIGCFPPDEAARTLVDLANMRGGPDNITVIVVQVDGAPVAQDIVEPEPPPPRRRTPILLTFVLLCLIAAGVLYALNLQMPAYLCGIVAIVTIIVGVLMKFDGDDSQNQAPDHIVPLGRGPHRSYDCAPSAEMAQRFGETTKELREIATQINLSIDWNQFDKMDKKARTAVESGDMTEAIRQRCRIISFVVGALKNYRQQSAANDSKVDLI